MQDINLDLGEGEVLGVIGLNGSGKSTLLRVAAGIYTPQRGSVKHRSKRVSLLSLQLGFDPLLSGEDNALFGAMLLGYTRREALAALPEIIEFSELNDAISNPVKTYSSGMTQRLAFSIALYINADVIMVDEVLSVGDQSFAEKAERAMISKITGGRSAIFVSHSGEQITRLCSRSALVHEGRVALAGPTDEVMDLYQEVCRDQNSINCV